MLHLAYYGAVGQKTREWADGVVPKEWPLSSKYWIITI
jgi:hypothetical protein